MKRPVTLAAAAAVLILLAGCGSTVLGPGSGSSGTAGSSGSSDGDNTAGMIPVPSLAAVAGTYTLVNTVRSPKALVAGSTIRLQVTDKGIAVNAGCNHISGQAAAKDSKLVVTGLMMTEMGCSKALMDQDSWIVKYLENSPRLERSGPYLSLSWDDGWLGFSLSDFQVAPDPSPTNPDEPISSPAPTRS